jgi:transposase
MTAKGRRGKSYPPEVRERSVRMVLDQEGEYPSRRAAMLTISNQLGISYETLRRWVRQAESQTRYPSEWSSQAHARLKELERENRELRQANEILKSAAAFYGSSLERRVDK